MRITKSLVSELDRKRPEAERFIFDSEVRGLYLRVRPEGRVAYGFRYQAGDRTRSLSLGLVTEIELEKVRERARELRELVSRGKDPKEEIERSSKAVTIEEFFQTYLRDYIQARNKPSTQAAQRYLFEKVLLPKIGHFKLAEVWEYRAEHTNPVRMIQKHKEKPRDRVLMPEEISSLLAALRSYEEKDPRLTTLIRLLLLTGCRLGEIQFAKLENVDKVRRILTLPDSKSGAATVELPDEALEIIEKIPRTSLDRVWLVPGYIPGQPIRSPYSGWKKIRELAKLKDLHIHDLRHVFGTYSHALGADQSTIKLILRHTSFATSERYIHGFKTQRRRMVEKTARTLLEFEANPAFDVHEGRFTSEAGPGQ